MGYNVDVISVGNNNYDINYIDDVNILPECSIFANEEERLTQQYESFSLVTVSFTQMSCYNM